MSHEVLAQNAITLLESILDEQIEHEPDPSHQLASGLYELAIDGYENRLIPILDALDIMSKCYGITNPGEPLPRLDEL
jgi:hypothetical protein